MASGDLEFLLKSYLFLNQALSAHSAAMNVEDRERLRQERAATFGKLLTQRTENPSIALLQLRTLLECLSHAPDDAELAKRIADAARDHVEQLSRVLPARNAPASRPAVSHVPSVPHTWPDAARLRMFDAASDRIVILDTDYRYRFSNKANAVFHDRPADAFIDKPLWAMTCEKFFARVTKPVFDRCFAGHALAFVTSHPGRDPSELHSGHVDPILDEEGRVVGALVVARRVDGTKTAQMP